MSQTHPAGWTVVWRVARRKAVWHNGGVKAFPIVVFALLAQAGGVLAQGAGLDAPRGCVEDGIHAIGERPRKDIVSFFTDNVFGRRPAEAVRPPLLKFEKTS